MFVGRVGECGSCRVGVGAFDIAKGGCSCSWKDWEVVVAAGLGSGGSCRVGVGVFVGMGGGSSRKVSFVRIARKSGEQSKCLSREKKQKKGIKGQKKPNNHKSVMWSVVPFSL